MDTDDLLRSLGELIRSHRVSARLTQRVLGSRAGIVSKYVSEIERGTRDVPLSTLRAIVERGLHLHLEIVFRSKGDATGPLPMHIVEVATAIAALPPDVRSKVLALVRGIVELTR
jgi:transcriptional regulator with XRE-family HTH domain